MGTSKKYKNHFCSTCGRCVDNMTALQQEEHIKMHDRENQESLKQKKLFE